jgi:hypothetical protein
MIHQLANDLERKIYWDEHICSVTELNQQKGLINE